MSDRLPAPYAGGPLPGGPEYYGYAPLEQPERGEGPGIDLRMIFAVLRRDLWLILVAGILGLAGGFFVGSQVVPEYRATAVVQFVDPQRGVAGGLGVPALTPSRGTDIFASQFEVLRSRAVLGQVVDELGLRFQPAGNDRLSPAVVFSVASVDSTLTNGDTLEVTFGDNVTARLAGATATGAYGELLQLPGFEFSVPERPAVERAIWTVRSPEAASSYITRTLEARRRGMTDIVDVRFTSTDRLEAAIIVNATAHAFQRHDSVNSRQQLDLRRAFIEGQLARTDSMLSEAQIALSEFNQRERLERNQTRIEAYESQRVTLEMERLQLSTDRAFYRDLLSQLESADPGVSEELEVFVTAPGILSHPIVSARFSELMGYVDQRKALTTGDNARSLNHPEVVTLDTLISMTHRSLTSAVRGYIQGLEEREQQLMMLERAGASNVAALSPDPEVELEAQRLIQQVAMLSRQAEQLRAERQATQIADAVEVGQIQIIDDARPPTAPLSTNTRRARTAGLAIGLLIGLAGAAIREAINNTIRGRKDLERSLNTTGLAVIPALASGAKARRPLLRLKGGNGNGSRKASLVTQYDSRSVGADAFRSLRTNLVLNRSATRLKTLLVTSAAPAEGKSTVAANLAVTFAQQGVNTLLVDCDIRHPSLDKIFEVDRRPGLTDWVTARNLFSECVRKSPTDHLWLLPAGALPSNPVEFLGGARMRTALQALSEKFEMVVIDTCPVLAAADPIVLGVAVDGIIVVTRANKTKRAAAQLTVDKLTRVGGRVLGVVLNDPDGALELYDDYGYGYSYYAYYGDEPEDQPAVAARG